MWTFGELAYIGVHGARRVRGVCRIEAPFNCLRGQLRAPRQRSARGVCRIDALSRTGAQTHCIVASPKSQRGPNHLYVYMSQAVLGPYWGAFQVVFRPSWRPPGPSWAVGSPKRRERPNRLNTSEHQRCCPLGCHLEGLLDRLETIFGRIGGISGEVVNLIGPSFAVLEAIFDRLGPTCSLSWAILAA